MHQALVEAEVADTGFDLAVLDEKGAVAGHTGKHLLVRFHFADIPATRYQDTPFGRGDHLLDGLRLVWRLAAKPSEDRRADDRLYRTGCPGNALLVYPRSGTVREDAYRYDPRRHLSHRGRQDQSRYPQLPLQPGLGAYA